jgi:arylsulfatase
MSNAKPNILIIMTDQHRFDCLGATGNPDIHTPMIDRLAADGVIYNNCFCAAPFCTPSRHSFVTGLYSPQHSGNTNTCTIPNGMLTFPKVLQENGYRTKAVGKMHYTPTYQDVGFDSMVLAEQAGNGRYDDDYHAYLLDHGLTDVNDLTDQVKEFRKRAPKDYWDSFGVKESNLPEQHHSTTWIANQGMDALSQWEGNGNLLMVSFIKPHHPFDPPAPWSEMYDPEQLKPLPGWTETCSERDLEKQPGYFPYRSLTLDKLRKIMAHYYGAISQIDHHVGRLLQLLQDKGMYKDTLILFTSDHGEYLGFHHMVLKGGFMYDPLSRIPLIIKYPDNHGHGTRRNELTSNVDIAPTLFKQCGLTIVGLPGIDLSADSIDRQYVFSQQAYGVQFMLRSHTRKLIYSRDPKQRLFFNLETDPYEMNNLYGAPESQEEIQIFIRKLSDMVLFELQPPIHLDLLAPTALTEEQEQAAAEKHRISKEWFKIEMNRMGGLEDE